eukprot:365576-Chlamydomonas_euryale.AAC.11
MGELESIVGGTDLAGRAARGDMELQYAEFGVGGGGGDNGDAFASGAEQAVRQPFWGIYGPYTYGSDPWRVPELRAVMRRFWTTAAEWLAGGGGPTYHVTACYAWSLASWDGGRRRMGRGQEGREGGSNVGKARAVARPVRPYPTPTTAQCGKERGTLENKEGKNGQRQAKFRNAGKHTIYSVERVSGFGFRV